MALREVEGLTETAENGWGADVSACIYSGTSVHHGQPYGAAEDAESGGAFVSVNGSAYRRKG